MSHGFDTSRLRRIDSHFQRYVDDGRLAGWQVMVSRHGELAHHSTYGLRDLEQGTPFTDDTVVRLYSMTKPLTTLAAMQLVEEGVLQLKDPVAKYIPSFAHTQVYRSGSVQKPMTEPQTLPMLVWHLMTHMSGLTYGFHNTHPVDAMYRNQGFEWGQPEDLDLAACCERWAELPLVFQPGTEWNYGVSTDVLGRVVEVASGLDLEEYFQERILGPLGMVDTSFYIDDENRKSRLAELYVPSPETGAAMRAPDLLRRPDRPAMLSGGGGLYGTAADYLRFCQMILNGGVLDGERVVGRHTLSYMGRNHLPGNVDLEAIGRPLFAESAFVGVGFGLGFSVVLDAAASKVPSTAGEMAWGGAASTAFWVDPQEDLAVVFLTQLLPSSTHPIRPELKQLVYQGLAD
ncbi:MAG: serine hydrolase [Actinobacteria bacterium]|nr:serine hydrolase [Actinomycetota bacterium]MDA2961228.1 serine hydrolase [Actinomycetota bacterium]MDA2994077.1 serine hydrolase [Actinomycetota bacterium]